MRVSEFTKQFKGKLNKKGITKYNHLDDSDFIQLIIQQNPELSKKIDRQDLASVMKESQAKSISKERQKQFGALSGYNRFASGTGQGMIDIYQGIKQMFGGDTKDYQDDKSAYMDASKGNKMAAAGEMFGALAATAPIPGFTGAKLAGKVAAPLAKTGIALGSAAAVGAGFGASEFVDEDETRAKNTAYGSLFGAGGAGAGMLIKKVGTKGYNALKSKMKDAPTQELFDLAKKYKINLRSSDITGEGKFGDKALERILLGGMSAEAKKTSKQVQGVIQSEKSKLTSGWDDEIQESLQRKAKAGKAQAKINYNKVEEYSSGITVKPDKALKRAGELEKEISESILGSETNPFSKIRANLAKKDRTFSELRKDRSDLGKAAKKASDSQDRNLSRQYMELKDAVENDIENLVNKKIEVGDFVHETNVPDVSKFDLSKSGTGQGQSWLGDGVYFQKKGSFKLEKYGKNKIEASLNPDAKIFKIKDTPKGEYRNNFVEYAVDNDIGRARMLAESARKEGLSLNNILPRDILKNNPKATDQLRKKGFDGLLQDGEFVAYNPDVVRMVGTQDPRLKEAFHKAQSQYKKDVIPYTDRKILNDLQTDAPDEIFNKYIKPKKGDKAENFYKLLDDKGKKALKTGFLENAFKGATDDINDPDAFYSPKKLSNYFSKMADSKNKIFTPEELKHYNGFSRLMKHSERYGQNNESPSNGMMAIPYILGGSAGALLKTNPVGGSLALGGGLLASNMATFMKTYGKRLTLASGEIGSEAFEKNISKIMKQLPKIAAVSGKELTEE